ncbi:MAG TPA: hypothetical protein VJN71_10880 [Nitrososphaerales archaeon]|nr:hypothetical protein [Nitrososphaerales archaeon]
METESVGKRKRNLGGFAKYIIAAIVIFLIILYASYTFLQWAVFQAMYQLKFENLNWFGTVFYHDYAFILPAIVALAVIYPFPNRSDLFAFLRTLTTVSRQRRTFGGFSADIPEAGVVPREVQSTSRTIWLFWQFIKWGIAYGIAYASQGFLFYPNATEALMFNNYGIGSWSLVPQIIALPLFPASGQGIISLVPTMETQYYLIVVATGTILVILGVRFFLRLLTNAFTKGGNKWIGDLLAFVFVILLAIWFGTPYWLMNVTTPYLYYVLLIFMAGALFGIAYFRLSGKGLIPITARRRGATKIIAVVIGLILIVNLGTLAYFGVNWNNNWLEYQWTPQIQKQISVTRWAAGLDNVTTLPITNIPTGNISQILGLVRQWDQNASLTRSQSQIGLNYLSISNAEIVYLGGQQYWISPTTISYPPSSQDWISEHLIYTHTDRVIVLNAHSGVYVNLTKALGLPSNPAIDTPLIYYGEGGGYYNSVFVNVKDQPLQIPDDNYTWQPDYVLSGGQRALWFFVQGPSTWGFAFTPPQDGMPMLFNRDVFSRVASTLINGLAVDPQTYLVSDGRNLYYNMMVYIDYPLQTGFAGSDFMRNFADILVNVNDGSMSAYVVDNSSDFLSSFFRSYYSGWNSSLPAWLVPQLRYPEQLLGTQQQSGQLDVDFTYHVSDSSTWRSSADFYERPSNTPIYYILVNEGNNLYYVGLQLANFLVSQGLNLGGVYLAYGGSRLGQIYLYQVPINSTTTNKLIGPQAALQAAETNSTFRQQLNLLGNPTFGNVLPYLINSQIYYFIPIYANTAQSSAVITKLAFVSVVDASNGVSAYGSSAVSAFSQLLAGESGTPPPIFNSTATLDNVVNAFKSQGLSVSTLSAVNFNLGNQTNTIYLSSASISLVNSTTANFVARYDQNRTVPIYEWLNPGTNATNFGVVESQNGLVSANYISVYP